MSSVDNRIVQMQFDNKQFESGVKQTMTSLESLKKSLNFTNATKGFDTISAKANKTDLSGLKQAVESVKDRFNAMGIIGITVLQNITNAAINAGTKITKALTLQPILDGFAEYETQINAVQTILANTQKEGTNIKTVNAALDTLNTYADKTIYNFTEMTRNIGTFTAAGVKLQTSVDSIQGIANLAAVSGSTSQQASTAMYQLSQALAAGKVQLMDWNSVVNAGMGGQVFQNALIRTSEHLKTGAKAAIEAKGSFRESLQEGWLTSKVLTETLNQFALNVESTEDYEKAMKKLVSEGYTKQEAKEIVDMAKTAGEAATKVKTFTQLIDTLKEALGSGWTQSWRIIVGDFEEAKELWTEVSDVLSGMINDSAQARNDMLQGWSDLGGRKALIEGLRNAFEALMSVVKPVSEAIREVFPRITSEQLMDLTNKFKDFTASLKLNETDAANLKNVIVKLATAFKTVLDFVFNLITKFNEVVQPLNLFSGGLELLSTALNTFGNLVGVIAPLLTGFFTAISEGLTGLTSGFSNLTSATGTAANGLTTILLKTIETIPTAIATAIAAIGQGIKLILDSVPINEVLSIIQNVLFTLILKNINKFISGANKAKEETVGIFDKISEIFDKVEKSVDKFTEVLDKAKGSIKAFTQSIQANIILKIAVALGILALSMKTIADIPVDNIVTSMGALSGLLAVLLAVSAGIIVFITKMSTSISDIAKFSIATSQITKLALSMVFMAAAIKILSSAVETFSQMSWEDLAKGLAGIAGSITALVIAVKAIDKLKGVTKTTATLIAFSIAIRIIAEAFKVCGDLEWTSVAKGIIGIAGATAALIVATKALSTVEKNLLRTSAMLIAFSVAINLMVSAIKGFDDVEASSVVKAAVSMALMIGAIKLIDIAAKDLKITKSVALIGIIITYAQVIRQFSEAIKLFNDVSPEGIAKTIASITSLFAIIVGFNFAMKGSAGEFAAVSGGLWAISQAIDTFIRAVQTMSNLSLEQIAKSIVGIAGGVTIMMVALTKIPKKEVIAVGASFILLGVGLLALAKALRQMSTLSIEDIGKSLLTLSGSLLVIVKTMNALTKTKELPKTAASLLLIGVALATLIAPIKTLGEMDTRDMVQGLAGLGAALVIVSVATTKISRMAGSMAKTAIGLITLGAAILVFGIGLSAMIYPIKSLAEMDPGQLTNGVVALAAVIGTLFTLSNTMNALPGFSLKAVAKIAVMTVVIGMVGAVIGKLASIDSKAALESAISLSMVLVATSAALAVLQFVPIPAALTAIASLAIVIAGISAIVIAMGAIKQIPGVQWLVDEGKAFMQSIGEAIGGFVGGIVGGAMSAATNQLPIVGTNLSEFTKNATPFFNTMSKFDCGEALNGIKSLAEAMVLITGADIMNSATKWLTGGNSMTEFGKQICEFAPYLQKFASSIKGIDSEAITASANAAKILAEFAKNIPAEGGLLQNVIGNNDLESFGKKLELFGPSLANYSKAIKDINPEAVTASANAAKTLAEFATNIPAQGGLAQTILGDQDIESFGTKIVSFGKSISEYAKTVKDVDAGSITASANAAKSLSELANNLPSNGGILQAFTGSQDLGTFGNSVSSFGKGLKSYGESVSGIDAYNGSITASVTAAKGLVKISTSIGNTGGIAQAFTGSQDLGTFGNSVSSFGKGLKSYGESVSGIDAYTDSITISVTAAKGLAKVASSLNATGGISQLFNGSQNLGDFGGSLKDLGTGIKDYGSAVSGIDTSGIGPSVSAIKSIANLMTSTVGIDTSGFENIGKALSNAGDMGIPALNESLSGSSESLKTNLNTITTSIKSAATGISEASGTLASSANSLNTFTTAITKLSKVNFSSTYSGINKVTNAINTMPSKISSAGGKVKSAMNKIASSISTNSIVSSATKLTNKLGTTLASGMKNAGSKGSSAAKSAMKSIITAGTSTLNSGVSSFKSAGVKLANAISTGIKTGQSKAKTAVKNIINACKSAASNVSGFKSIGKNMADGIRDGVNAGKSGVVNAMVNTVKKAIAEAKKKADIHSPSRVTRELGQYMALGFAYGIEDYTNKVGSASAKMTQSAISNISSPRMTITPVISSDNAGVIRGLSANRTLSLNAKIIDNKVMSPITAMQQSISAENAEVLKSNNRVVDAITNLREDMGNYTTAISDMENAVYVDGKKLASSIAKPINQQLGILQKRGY